MAQIEIKFGIRNEMLYDLQRKAYMAITGSADTIISEINKPVCGRSIPLPIMNDKQKKTRTFKGRSKRVTIPAGHEYIVFKPKEGDKVFLIRPGVEWPIELQKLILEKCEVEAKRAYEAGRQSLEQDTATRMYSPEESFSQAITAIRRHAISDQNKIAAHILKDLSIDRRNAVDALQHDIEQTELKLVNAVELQKQLNEIQQGKTVVL